MLGSSESRVVLDLQEHSVALAAAGADRREPEPAAAAPQLVRERREDACARGADRMPERDGAAVHVDPLRVGAEELRRVEDDRGERLVQLDALHVLDRAAGALEGEESGP